MATINFRALAASLCVTLTACGGGGDEVTAPAQAPVTTLATPPAPVAELPCRDVRVILFGDSTMQGSQKYTLDANGRTALGRYLDTHTNRRVILNDQSAPGTTSSQMIAGWDGVKQGPVWPYKPDADFIVVNHGLNDAARVDGATYDLNLRIVASAGVPVVFETPNPTPDPMQNPTGYAAIMRTVAFETNNTLADVYAYVTAQPNWQALIGDGAHPTYELYLDLASNVVGPAMIPLVAATPCH